MPTSSSAGVTLPEAVTVFLSLMDAGATFRETAVVRGAAP